MNLTKETSFYSLKIKNLLIIFLALGAFLSIKPYFIWDTAFFRIVSVPSLTLSFIYFVNTKGINKNQLLLVTYFTITAFILNFSSNGFILYINATLLIIFIFLLMDNEDKEKVYDLFCKLFTVSVIPGLFVLFLAILGIDLPWEPLESTHEKKEALGLFYRKYWGSVVLNNQIYSTGLGEIFRFSAMYDEPGVVGTVSALILVANRMKLSTISYKIIFLSGIVSFSLAFYILITAYLILRNPPLLIKLLIPFFIFIALFHSNLKENDLINHYVFDRFENSILDPKSIDNRVSSCFEEEFNRFIENGNLYIGNGAQASVDINCGQSTYLNIIYDHGFLGFSAIIIFYILLLLSLVGSLRTLLYIFPFVLVFSLSLYQRPDFFSIWMIVIFSAAILKENTTHYSTNGKVVT